MFDSKFLKRVVNDNLTEYDKNFILSLFEGSVKDLKKEMKEKEINAAPHFKASSNSYLYLVSLNQYIGYKMKDTKEKGLKFLYNEKEAIKAGWNLRKPNQEKLMAWYEKACPKMEVIFWENEVNKNLILNYLKLS